MDKLGGEFDAFGAHEEFDDHLDDDGAHSNPPPSAVGQDERRMQVRAYNHWASQLGAENLPHIEDLEPEFLGDFGPYSTLLDFSTGSGTPTLQYIGEELRHECRLHDHIETLQEIPANSLLSKIADNYLKVVAAQAPVAFEAESENARGKSVAYRGILLPYSSDYDTIDFVYAVVNWKEVADAQTAEALLGEIDSALELHTAFEAAEPQVEDVVADTAEIVHFEQNRQDAVSETYGEEHFGGHDNILDLRDPDSVQGEAVGDLPAPNFGDFEADEANGYPEADNSSQEPKRNRSVDALGNPIGGMPAAADDEDEEAKPAGITTAADYGLPEWDDEEDEGEDVEDLVNPLANIDLNSRLLALVNSGSRGKKTIDLSSLSDQSSNEEEEAVEGDRGLFRPKAPSVETLLTPEDYDPEEDSEIADWSYDHLAPEENSPATEAAIGDYPDFNEVEPEDSTYEAVGPSEKYIADAEYDRVPGNTNAPEIDASYEEPQDTAHFSNEVPSVTAAEAEPDFAEAEALEEPLELSEELILKETVEEPVAQEVVEAQPAEVVEQTEIADKAEPESLTGLLAAVRDLAEAARNTEDPSRRALYEAVGRAFDVSIKAVIAAETHAEERHRVLAQLPVGELDESDQEMALVMVRRTANGGAEVIGEVPHDSILMETAALKLASK